MAPKKKKTQLKPVARGFATTSVPKKVVEVPKEAETPDPKDTPSSHDENAGESANEHPTGTPTTDVNTLSEADQVLQTFIDKFQDKVEKEIVRTVKVRPALLECEWGMHEQPYIQAIEQERRFSETLLRLELDPRFVNRILELGLEYENSECMYLYGPNRNHVDEICSHQGD